MFDWRISHCDTQNVHILYINGHPDAESFHSAIRDAFVSGLQPEHEVEVLNLGQQSFDPVLRYGYRQHMPADPEIFRAQKLVLWADHLVFAFPVWWGDAPALLKGWIERVFVPGVTYNVDGLKIIPHLRGRTADIVVTQRGIRPLAWVFGNHHVGILKRNLFALCGIKLRKVLSLGGVGLVALTDTSKRRTRFLNKVKRAASTL